jgi:hypothetical protein
VVVQAGAFGTALLKGIGACVMLRPTVEASAAEILSFAREWVEFAAEHGLRPALAELDQPEKLPWTEELFKQLTFNHFDDGEHCSITSSAGVDGIRVEAYEYNDGSGFAVDHDLALNGKRSDLTAQFDFRKDVARYRVYLEAFHVL